MMGGKDVAKRCAFTNVQLGYCRNRLFSTPERNQSTCGDLEGLPLKVDLSSENTLDLMGAQVTDQTKTSDSYIF
jgi:hypothetical protein